MEILILASLIVLNGLFAMSEVALLTARRPRLATLAHQGDSLASAAIHLAEHPTRFLSTIQIGITSIGLLNGIFGEALLAGPLAVWLQSLGVERKASSIIATTVIVIGVTYASIVVGELVPKRLGQLNAEGISRLVAWPMRALAVASAPFVHLLTNSTEIILRPLLKLFRLRSPEAGAQPMSPEEIRTIVLESSNFMPKKHVSILLNLFDLGNVTVEDIMVPRSRVEAVILEEGMQTVSHKLATSYHMRLPVFRNREGELAGVLHLRRILGALHAGTLDEQAILEVLDEPYFVPAGTTVLTQLQYFQENKERIALVVDEYGELMGLVTLEDIIEEIIGKFTTSMPSAAQGGADHGFAAGAHLAADDLARLVFPLPSENDFLGPLRCRCRCHPDSLGSSAPGAQHSAAKGFCEGLSTASKLLTPLYFLPVRPVGKSSPS